MFDPLALARRLIDIPSPTEQEREMGAFLHETLTALGYTCRVQDVTADRFNVFAAAGGRPRVVLNSHIDTVPPWFAFSEDDDWMYGRGACDTKGVIAAMIAAGERLRAGGFDDFAFLFVVGEETDSIGAKTANVAFHDLGSEYVIVGEPTESTFARASKGALTIFAAARQNSGSGIPRYGQRQADCFRRPAVPFRAVLGRAQGLAWEPKVLAANTPSRSRRRIRTPAASGSRSSP